MCNLGFWGRFYSLKQQYGSMNKVSTYPGIWLQQYTHTVVTVKGYLYEKALKSSLRSQPLRAYTVPTL